MSELQQNPQYERLCDALESLARGFHALSSTLSQNQRELHNASPYLTPIEAAQYLRIEDPKGKGRKRVMEWARTGQIPSSKVGKDVRFDRDQLDAWMKKGGSK